MKKVVVIDDEKDALVNIAQVLEGAGYTVAAFTDPVTAVKTIEMVQDIDLVLTDINMPALDGMGVIRAALGCKRPVPVIVFTGHGDVDTAVNTMKAGASDFLCKPISSQELLVRVKKVLEKQDLAIEVETLKKKLASAESFHAIVGKSKRMLEVYELISIVASTDATVLIRGETGTGKELVARAVHDASRRKDDPFVAISCTAIQHTLLESELFGHEKGSFTGANSMKVGKLESAGAGTIFLDEVGDTSREIQVKLLRVLQEREFERVGGIRPIKLDARIIAATNRDLERAVRDNAFREDLYYRLNVVQIDVPPLRSREEDIVLLANHFLELFARHYEKLIEGFAPGALDQLLKYHWPGNVRELKNAIERTVLTNPRRWVDKVSGLEALPGRPSMFQGLPGQMNYAEARETVLSELEKTYLIQFMRQEKGQINKVAELLGVSTRTVSRALEKYGLDKTDFKEKSAQKEPLGGGFR